MDDKELLEKAARVVGLEVRACETGPRAPTMQRKVVPWPGEPYSKWLFWDPLRNDEDAFRLMAELNLNLGFDGTSDGVEVSVLGVWDGGPDEVCEVFEGNDAAPAMRRAIVRAAASMAEENT